MRSRTYLLAVLVVTLCAQLLWVTTHSSDDSTPQVRRTITGVTKRPAGRNDERSSNSQPFTSALSSNSQLSTSGLTLAAPAGALRVRLNFSSSLAAAWKSSSRRESFESTILLAEDGGISRRVRCTVTLYGKSSLKLKYTTRRSVEVLTHEPVQLHANGPSMRRFVLLSLWEDSTRLGYRSSAALLANAGLFYSDFRLVDFGCAEGESASAVCSSHSWTLGVYLALEYPSDAIIRAARSGDASATVPCRTTSGATLSSQSAASPDLEVEVGTRNWFYFEKPAKYDLLHVPSYQRNSSLSALYRAIEADPFAAETAGQLDLAQYLLWLVANTLLQNGDYDDEVFVWATRANGKLGPLRIAAWDYDNVFAPCHRGGKQALKTKLMYCAETPLERAVLNTPALLKRYTDMVQCALAGPFSKESWDAVVKGAQTELSAVVHGSLDSDVALATWPRGSNPRPTSLTASDLTDAFNARAEMLTALIGRSGPTSPATHAAGSSTKCPAIGPDRFRKAFAAEHKGTVDTGKSLKTLQRELGDAGQGATVMVQWQLGMKGNTTWGVTDPAAAGGAVANEGLHCAALVSGDGKTCAAVPFVVRSRERGKTEFGVAHWTTASLASLAAPLARTSGVSLKAPAIWPAGLPFPLVARALRKGSWDRSVSVASLELEVDGAKVASLLVMRGFSGTLASTRSGNNDVAAFGPILHLGDSAVVVAAPSTDEAATVRVPTATAGMPVVVPAEVTSTFMCPAGAACAVSLAGVAVRASGRFILEPGSALLVAAGAEITIDAGAHLEAMGTAGSPISITAPEGSMRGIACMGVASKISMAHVFLTRSGMPLPDKSEDRGTGHHHHHTAAITATQGCSVSVRDSVLFALRGPAFAAGSKTSLLIRDTLVQQAEMGAECTGCDFDAERTAWLQLASPSMREAPFAHGDGLPLGPVLGYEDNDNDALYLSGGSHRVIDSVIARTTDDGIDTGNEGAPQGSHDGGSLTLQGTIIEDTQHEGVAVSGGATGLGRQVSIRSCLIQRCQQGLESGYADAQTQTVAESTVIKDCEVGVRFGDNYRRDQKGQLLLKDCVLDGNVFPALNYVRKLAGPATHAGALSFERTRVGRGAMPARHTACAGLLPALPDASSTLELDLFVPLESP